MRDFIQELLDKMESEQAAYKAELLKLPPEQILDKAFEYTWRDEVLMSVGAGVLSPKQANALRKLKNPLDACYQEWMKVDSNYLDSLRDCITDRANLAIKEQKAMSGRDCL